MSYIGSTPTTQSFISGTDYFNGDGSTTAFTLSRNVVSVNDIEVVVNNVVQQPNTAYNVMGTTITFTGAPSAGTNNIYVRYLSTTTQSITPSQNTVSYSTMNTDMQGLFGQSFTNRIINGAMMIDQRNAGASVTPNNSYTLDRWSAVNSQTSKFTVQQNAGSVTPPAGFTNYFGITSSSAYSVGSSDYFGIYQAIEGFNTADLAWGTANAATVTLSFMVYSSLTGTFGGSLRNSAVNRSYPFSYTISSANTWTTVSVTIAGDTSGTWIGATNGVGLYVTFSIGMGSTYSGTAGSWSGNNYLSVTGATSVVGTSGATFYITGVQLEKGSTATSFDYRPYGTELALCQRYYNKVTFGYMAPGFCDSSTGFRGNYAYPVQMRSAPTLVTSGTAGDYGIRTAGVSFVNCSAVPTIVGATTSVARIDATVSSGLTTGYGAFLADVPGSTFLSFNAEL